MHTWHERQIKRKGKLTINDQIADLGINRDFRGDTSFLLTRNS